MHVLWSCGAAQDVWAGSLGRLQKSCTEQNDFLQLVTGLMADMASEEHGHSWWCIPASFKIGPACSGLSEGVYERTRVPESA